MRNLARTQLIAVLAILVAAGAVWTLGFERGPRVNSRLHAAIGKALAREALNLRRGDGPITVISRDTEAFRQPAMEILLKSFSDEVRRGRATIAATHVIQVDPLRPVQVPPGDFFEWIRKAPAGSVIVSLLGPPLLPEEQVRQLGTIQPAIVAFCPGNLIDFVDFRMLFERKLLQAAIVSRPPESGPRQAGSSHADSFQQLYSVLTSKNLSELPPVSAAQR